MENGRKKIPPPDSKTQSTAQKAEEKGRLQNDWSKNHKPVTQSQKNKTGK